MSYFINYKKPEHPLKLIDWLIKKIKMLQKISLPIKLPFLCLKCPWYLLQYVTYYIMKGFIEQHISLNVTLASAGWHSAFTRLNYIMCIIYFYYDWHGCLIEEIVKIITFPLDLLAFSRTASAIVVVRHMKFTRKRVYNFLYSVLMLKVRKLR